MLWNYNDLMEAIKEGKLFEFYVSKIPLTDSMNTYEFRGKAKLTCKEFMPYAEFYTDLKQDYKQIVLTGRNEECGFSINIDVRNPYRAGVEGHIEYNNTFEVINDVL
jgi:hypothetical protein